MASKRATKRRSERGVVIIISLLAIVLLAALLLWVINLGQQVNHRITTQNAADASAAAGAAWMARSLNTVAMNNVEMARYIALINVLDSLPQAVDYSYREDVWFRQALEAQLARGVNGSPAQLADLVRGYYEDLLADIEDDIADLEPVDEMFKANDVTSMTNYQEDGAIWRAMAGLDEFNTALMENLGPITQTAAVAGGRVNFGTRENGQAAFVLPITPSVPYQRGQFNDFLVPVLNGRLPPDIDDEIIRRGPWDAVFGWRDIIYADIVGGGGGGGGTPRVANGGRANNPLSNGPSNSGGGGRGEPVAYRTYGPYSWMLRRMDAYDFGALKQTRLDYYLRRVSDRKFNYLWPGSRPNREVVNPDWRITYEEAKQIAQAGQPRIKETAFFVVEIKSSVAPGGPGFLAPGTWALEMRENEGNNPRVAIVRNWQDPAGWGITKLNSHVWRDEWEYEVYYDAELGIPLEFDADGNPIPVPVYRIDHIAFAGANVGEAEDVRNPYEGFNPYDELAPAPMNLNHTALAHSADEQRWEHLALLGVATRNDVPQGWPSRFHGGRPVPAMVGIAQAKVFNNHSWDLWTQMWQAELEPVSNYDQWLTRFDGGGELPSDLTQSDINAMREYLSNASNLARALLTH